MKYTVKVHPGLRETLSISKRSPAPYIPNLRLKKRNIFPAA